VHAFQVHGAHQGPALTWLAERASTLRALDLPEKLQALLQRGLGSSWLNDEIVECAATLLNFKEHHRRTEVFVASPFWPPRIARTIRKEGQARMQDLLSANRWFQRLDVNLLSLKHMLPVTVFSLIIHRTDPFYTWAPRRI
jgi:hypothetical protein